MEQVATASDLSGRWLSLVPVEDAHAEFIARLAVAESDSFRWRWGGFVPDVEEVRRSLHAGMLVQFVVVANTTGAAVGHVFAYDHDELAGSVWVAVAFTPEVRHRGFGLEAMGLFFDHLVRHWPLEVVLVDMVAPNVDQVASGLRAVFEPLGARRQDRYVDGAYLDSPVFGMPVDSWRAVRAAGRVRRGGTA